MAVCRPSVARRMAARRIENDEHKGMETLRPAGYGNCVPGGPPQMISTLGDQVAKRTVFSKIEFPDQNFESSCVFTIGTITTTSPPQS